MVEREKLNLILMNAQMDSIEHKWTQTTQTEAVLIQREDLVAASHEAAINIARGTKHRSSGFADSQLTTHPLTSSPSLGTWIYSCHVDK